MTTTDDPILVQMRGLLARFAPPELELDRETELAREMNVDSVAAMDIVMEIEDRYGFDVPVNRIPELRTVGDLVDLVQKHTRAE
jgi:acyl carrier protein